MFTKKGKMGDIQYAACYPDNFDENKKYPFLIYLNGAGSRGDTLDAITGNNYFYKLIGAMPELPFVVLLPLCHTDTWIDLWYDLRTLFISFVNKEYIDETRVYGMGVSMGGYGIWQLAMSHPEYFAAIVPICGGGMYWNSIRLKDVAIWAHHGELDNTVAPIESERMVQTVNYYGGNARLTIYPDVAHDAWIPTFANPELFPWLLSHTKPKQNN